MPELRVGLISDTHGLLRPEAVAALRGSDRIVHAGDIVDPAILDALAALAPVTAVRGNNDRGPWAEALPEAQVLTLGALRLFVVHDRAHLARHAGAAGCDVVVTGHSHQPRVERRDGVLFVNPGSAGPRRFRLPVTVGRLDVAGAEVQARIVEILQG
jgi:putative phosphoesterase